MPTAEPDDEEDWYDDEEESEDDESCPCPECGAAVFVITGKCPSCGYWLSEADRRAMWAAESKPLWLRATVVIVIIALLASVLVGIAARLF